MAAVAAEDNDKVAEVFAIVAAGSVFGERLFEVCGKCCAALRKTLEVNTVSEVGDEFSIIDYRDSFLPVKVTKLQALRAMFYKTPWI